MLLTPYRQPNCVHYSALAPDCQALLCSRLACASRAAIAADSPLPMVRKCNTVANKVRGTSSYTRHSAGYTIHEPEIPQVSHQRGPGTMQRPGAVFRLLCCCTLRTVFRTAKYERRRSYGLSVVATQ